MKKFYVLFAAVALMAMTACNEKPAKNDTAAQDQNAPATEQVDNNKQGDGSVKVDVEKAKPTEDGKDHTVAEQVAESKQCVMKDDNYLMKTSDGTAYLITAKKGAEKLVIMNGKEILYPKQ